MSPSAGLLSSERTLIRRFHERTRSTPQKGLQRQRLNAARRLLETTELPIESVARRVGLGTATNLRHLSRTYRTCRTYRTTPSAYRARFRQGPPTSRAQ